MATKIAVLSDTHGLLRPEVLDRIAGCDVIIHGGDINKPEIIDRLKEIAPVYVVRGNNDKEWAENIPESLTFQIEQCRFFVVHNRKFVPKDLHDTDVVIYGHSHKYAEQMANAKRTGQSARLIIREGSGYRRNPTLKITTDIEQFDLHLKAAETASGSAERIEELRKAVELYKGPVFMCGRDQLWLNDIVSQYEVRYIKAADALMRELAKQKDYAGVMEYAVRAHELFPGNGLICYWLIMATYSLSGADMAKKEYFRLKDDMTQEEIDVVTEHLKKNSLIRYEELFGV